jgi:hypothetical protein
MLENAPHQHGSNPGEYDTLRQALLRPIQHQLAKQGIHVSPEQSLLLLEHKIEYNAMRYLQQDLAEQGIVVSPDEALAIQKLRIIHLMIEHTVTTHPHEAIERMAPDDSSKPYELDE